MRITYDGSRWLGASQGIHVGPPWHDVAWNASAWDFLTKQIIGLGGYDTPDVGRYTATLDGAQYQRVIDPTGANFHTAITKNLWTDGATRWLIDCTDGARDSDGSFWPDRQAVGSSRQGDWCFIRKPDYTALIVRRWNGAEATIEVGGAFFFGGVEDGLVLLHLAGGGVRQFTTDGHVVGPLDLPYSGPFTRDRTGRLWIAAYQPDLGHCVAAVDELPYVYTFFNDPNDFNPAIASRADGMLVCVTGQNAGETLARV